MNAALHIAKRLTIHSKRNFSRFIVKLTIVAVTLSTAAMIVAVCIIQGFTLQIKDRIFGFWSHAEIVSNENNDNYEPTTIVVQDSIVKKISRLSNVNHISEYVIKSGIIKTKKDIEGIVIKGVGITYDWNFMNKYLIKGNIPRINTDSTTNYRDILISQHTANRLKVDINDKLVIYFLNKDQGQPIGRKFIISGIYHTGLVEYDIKYAITDRHILQQLNRWGDTIIHGYEIKAASWKDFEPTVTYIYNNILPNNLDIHTIQEKYPNIFDWLKLQNITSIMALSLLIIVAIFNIITAFLLIILDNIQTIGILKSLGATNKFISITYMYNTILVISIGILLGNILGLGLALIQKYYGIIQLNEDNYYFATAPIEINLIPILLINVVILFVSILALLLPSSIISKISPVRILRFD